MIQTGAERGKCNPAITDWLFIVLLVIIASALRLYQLDSQLWLDEVSALRGYRKPFLETLTTFPGFFPNPLYELLAHASLITFGMSSWAIRLPAALFGIAGVIIFYRLARRCIGSGNAELAAALFAVSYHHVFYSQDARGYTTYLFFALLSTSLLLTLIDHVRWKTVAAYVLSTALAAYAHPFGIFLLAGHMVVTVVVAMSRQRKPDREAVTPWQIVGIGILTGAAILMLFAPLIQDAINYALTEARAPEHGRKVTSLAPELLEGLKAGFGGWPGLILGSLVGFLGLYDLLRRQPIVLALLVTPVVVSAVAMIALGAGVHPRYFILALPIGYLVGTQGVMLVVRWVARKSLGASPGNSVLAQVGFGVVIFAAACIPLQRYYQLPKQDYLGALREVRQSAEVDDRVVAAAHAGSAIALFYDPDLPTAYDLNELREVESAGQRVWVIATLEREMSSHRPELLRYLHRNYERIMVLPGTIGDGAMRIYRWDPNPSTHPDDE